MARFTALMMMFLAVAGADQKVCTDEASCVEGNAMLVRKTEVREADASVSAVGEEQAGPLSDLLAKKGLINTNEKVDALDPADVSDDSIAQLEEETRVARHQAEKALRAKEGLLQQKRQEKAAEEAKIEADKAEKEADDALQAQHENDVWKAEDMVHHGRMAMLDEFESDTKKFNSAHPGAVLWDAAHPTVLLQLEPGVSGPAKVDAKQKEIDELEKETKAAREESEKALHEKEELLQRKREANAQKQAEKESAAIKAKKEKEAAKKDIEDEEKVDRLMHSSRMARLDAFEGHMDELKKEHKPLHQ